TRFWSSLSAALATTALPALNRPPMAVLSLALFLTLLRVGTKLNRSSAEGITGSSGSMRAARNCGSAVSAGTVRTNCTTFAMERGSDGRLVLIGESTSKIDGNKTTPLLSGSDLWVLKLGPETPGDCDGDGVPDAQDTCPGTGPGVVNSNGCSIAQLCPCDGG